MRRLMIMAGCSVLLSVAGCASMKARAPAAPPDKARAAGPNAPNTAPPTNLDSTLADSAAPSPTAADHQTAQTPPAQTPPAQPRPADKARAGKSKSSIDNKTAKPSDPKGAPQLAPAAAAAPTLNLTELEQRLRDTHAIGVFTKLSLKNQVDDLLAEFRVLYQGSNKGPTAVLRQHYDLLLLKVLSLLQDSDPPLAAAISSSRDAIWGILADPAKFAKIAGQS